MTFLIDVARTDAPARIALEQVLRRLLELKEVKEVAVESSLVGVSTGIRFIVVVAIGFLREFGSAPRAEQWDLPVPPTERYPGVRYRALSSMGIWIYLNWHHELPAN